VYDDELRDVGIRTGQLTLLGVVAAHGRINQSALEHCLLMDRSTVSRTVRRMCDHGWLTTEPSEDARSHYLVVTEAGAIVLEGALPAWRRAQRRARELLGDDGFDALMALGNGVLKRLG
jgi:DNA-binding MarR family transcriptional regulator